MIQIELLKKFFGQQDENGISNLEKAKTKAKVIRRVATTDKNKSFEEVKNDNKSEELPGVVFENGKLIGFGIHIFNEDVYPLQSFEIYLRGCELVGNLELTDAKDMVFLDLYNNFIEKVELGDMPKMRILGLQNNKINELDINGLKNCLGIDVGKNRLTKLDVSENTELVELYVNDNEISEIDLTNNNKLKYFYCHNNKIRTLDTTNNPLLRHLNSTGNPMTEIRSFAPQCTELLPLNLKAEEGGYVGLKYNPIYNAQWKETGEWEQSYYATPKDGYSFAGWYDENDECIYSEPMFVDEYGKSRVLVAKFGRGDM